jgi:hypothetical protein
MSDKRVSRGLNSLRYTSLRGIQSIAGASSRMSQRFSRRKQSQLEPEASDDEIGDDDVHADAAAADEFFATIDDVGATGIAGNIESIGEEADEVEDTLDTSKSTAAQFPEDTDPNVLQLLNRLSVLSTNLKHRPLEDTSESEQRRPHFQPEVDGAARPTSELKEASRKEVESNPPEPVSLPPSKAPPANEPETDAVQHAHHQSSNESVGFSASVEVSSQATRQNMVMAQVHGPTLTASSLFAAEHAVSRNETGRVLDARQPHAGQVRVLVPSNAKYFGKFGAPRSHDNVQQFSKRCSSTKLVSANPMFT